MGPPSDYGENTGVSDVEINIERLPNETLRLVTQMAGYDYPSRIVIDNPGIVASLHCGQIGLSEAVVIPPSILPFWQEAHPVAGL